MPSSSLFLGSCSALVSVLSLLSAPVRAASGTYALQNEYSGTSFFDGWDFFNDADPNKGFVTYVDRTTASRDGLVGFSNGDAFLKVDSSNTYDASAPYYGNNGYGRPSVRIMTQQSFYHGLIIADIKHMPSGCGTWPAFWALGASGNWPNSGEIDIIEGVNNRQNALAALHTGGQCKIAGDSRTMTGTLQNNDCYYNVQTGEGAVGCAVLDTDTRSYGAGLNAAGGGVVAMEWTSDAIKIWSFPGQSVPSDISAGSPDPSGWGLPAQTFNGPDCDLDSVIKPQKLIFNTNFCGDFGNAVWQSEGCAAQTGFTNCNEYVASNPSAFADAYWQIGSVKYFQLSAAITTSSTTTTESTTSLSTFVTTTISTTSFDSTISDTSSISVGAVLPTLVSTSGTTTTSADLSVITDSSSTTDLSVTTASSITLTNTVIPILTFISGTLTIPTSPSYQILSSTDLPVTTASSITLINTVAPILTFNSGTLTIPTSPSYQILSSTSSQTSSPTITYSVSPVLTSTSFQASSPTIIYSVSPVVTSSNPVQSGWESWTEPSTLTNAIPAGQFFLPPLGSGVPITPGWHTNRPAQDWGVLQPASPTTPAVVSSNWAQWSDSDKVRTITLTKVWVEPCETGYTTRTVHIVTTHCGCTETPVPTIPMKTITTTCPEEWGFKTPVVMTVPNTAAVTWSALQVKPTGKDQGKDQGNDQGKDNGAENWPAWSSTVKTLSDKSSTWAEWTAYTPTVVSSTWKAWTPATPVATLPTTSQAGTGWQGSSNPYVAKWEGDATKTTIGAGVLGAAVAVLAFVL